MLSCNGYHCLGRDRLFDGSVKIANPDLPQGYTHLTIPSNEFPEQSV